jgi:ATP-dependent Lon protease
MLPWNVEDLTFDEARFTGDVRLFPLPDLVMFPHVVQPLHIFEPRYRDMLNEALDGDGLLAMAILAPGWQDNYEGRPALLPHLCVGKVVTHHRLDDGRYNLMLLGMRRGRIVAERPATKSFREAEVVLLDDAYPDAGEPHRAALQQSLALAFQRALPLTDEAQAEGPMKELLTSDVPLGVLTDLVSFALPLNRKLKQELLGEVDVDRRARLLLDAMGKPLVKSTPIDAAKTRLDYPPRFSAN